MVAAHAVPGGDGIWVDAFKLVKKQPVAAWVLSHLHADHYGGVDKRVNKTAPIYATKVRGPVFVLSVTLLHRSQRDVPLIASDK